jgi:hypothetical protein
MTHTVQYQRCHIRDPLGYLLSGDRKVITRSGEGIQTEPAPYCRRRRRPSSEREN